MNAIQRAIRRARRRLWLSRWLQLAGLALAVAAGAAFITLVADKTSLVVVPGWLYPTAAGAAVMLASLLSLRHRPTDAHVAVIVDDRLHLKDRLGTAIWAERLEGEFADFVKQDAERTAAAIHADEALKVNPGRSWSWVLPCWTVLALLVVVVEPFDPWGVGADRVLAEAQAEEEAAAVERLIEATSLVRELERPGGEQTDADPQDALPDLLELSRRDLSNPDMKRQVMAQLSEAQQRLAEAHDVKEQQVRALQNAMSALDAQEAGPADRFADALRRGDFEQARKELEELIRKVERGDLSPQEKEALKRQLENMSQQLQQMAQNAAAQQAAAQQSVNQQLQQAGLSQQQIQQLQQSGYNQQQRQQALQQQYQQQGMSSQQAQQKAQQQAQQMAQQMQQAQSQSQNQGQCQGLSQSMSQMAQSMGSGGQGMGQSGYGAQQQLAQMAQMQQQMRQMQQAQQQMASALHNLNPSQGSGQQQNRGGAGGRKAGTGDGGPELGAETNLSGQYQTRAEADLKDRDGRVIASWQTDGEVVAGDVVAFSESVTEARSEAERAVADDRVPRRYHGAVKGYFDQMPQSPDEVRRAPAAPR